MLADDDNDDDGGGGVVDDGQRYSHILNTSGFLAQAPHKFMTYFKVITSSNFDCNKRSRSMFNTIQMYN